MIKKIGLIIFLLVLVPIILFLKNQNTRPPECHDQLGCVHLAPKETIKIGVIQDLSSNAASFGTDQVRIYELVLAQRNNRLLNRPVDLIIEDSKCLPEYGVLASRRLSSNPKIVAILGTTCSASAAKASQIVSDAGYTMISGTNSAASLTSVGGKAGPDWYPGFFRTMISNDSSGKAAAIFVSDKLGIERVAAIHDGDIYTKGYVSNFSRKFKDLGGQMVLVSSVNKGEKNMIPVLQAVKNSGAQLLFIPIFQAEGHLIIKQIKKVPGLKGIKVLGGNALVNDGFINLIGNDGVGMYFVSIAPPKKTERLDLLAKQFKDQYGESPKSNLFDYGFDAINILLSAIEKTAVTYPSGEVLIGRKSLRDTLYNTRNYNGLTGILNADSFGDLGIPRFHVVQITDPALKTEGLKTNVVFSIQNVDQ